MANAWTIAREGARRFGGSPRQYFRAALRLAWADFKAAQNRLSRPVSVRPRFGAVRPTFAAPSPLPAIPGRFAALCERTADSAKRFAVRVLPVLATAAAAISTGIAMGASLAGG